MTFTIYSKHGCKYCQQIKLLMELNDIKFVEYRLGREFSGADFYSLFGEEATFPQVLMDKKHLGGCTDTIKYLLEES